MKLSPEKTRVLWRDAPHAHHRTGRRRLLPGIWPRIQKQHVHTEDEDNPDCQVYLGYTQALVGAFERAAKESASVSINPSIMDGQPCIAGTRIPVHSVLRAIEHYGSLEEAVKCYPHLTIPQVKDALFFAQTVLEPVDGIDETETTS
jgi:uncharacterized protein (DUF433 family)